jgi:hypothetical protein
MTLEKDKLVKKSKSSINGRKTRKWLYGLGFGFTAGLVFGCITWMPDAISLAQSHTVLPWLKFLIGTPVSILLFSLAGIIAIHKDSLPITMLCFATTAVIVALIAGHLPYEITSQAMQVVDPSLSKMISLPFHEGALTRTVLTVIINFVVAVFASLFFDYLVSQSYLSDSIIGAVIPLIIFILFFTLNGVVANDLNNKPFTVPIQKMSNLIGQAQEIQSGQFQLQPEFKSWVNIVLDLNINIQVPYRIFVERYDTAFVQLQLLVQFDQAWYRCFMMGDQPFYCAQYKTQ